MDDDIFEDTICVVNYTDSQKSISTTHAYSQECTDSSSGKESRRTYVLEVDSDEPPPNISRSVSANLHTYSLISQETFTQTSKTLIELNQINDTKETNTAAIETQTSHLSIVENKTIEYRIQVSGTHARFSRHELVVGAGGAPAPLAGADSDHGSDKCSSETLRIIDDGPKSTSADRLEPTDDTSAANTDTSRYDFNDSLEEDYRANRDARRHDTSERSVTESVDRDVEELYDKLERSFDLRSYDRPDEYEIPRCATLTPLTEETAGKAESAVQPIRKECAKTPRPEVTYKKNTTTSEPSMKQPTRAEENKGLKLPPIQRVRCGSSPPRRADRWDTRAAGLAAGEGADVSARTGRSTSPHLPSIYLCGTRLARASHGDGGGGASPARVPYEPRDQRETISIHHKIQQLKMPAAGKTRLLYSSTTTGSRSSSPGSTSCGGAGLGAGAGAEVTARGCEALCVDILARLRRHCSCARGPLEGAGGAGVRGEGSDHGAHWAEAVAVLEEIPVRFRGFWAALPEHRVADLLRLVTAQVESPRTRVARAACDTLAAVLTNTNYTKKPDFSEAVTALLVKTGSCVRPLRRAANVALDAVVARVDLTHCVTALCLIGVEHKNPSVRCATTRLLVVCAALARGGRGLLRAQPPTAAHARRHALRALSALLHDRNRDTRKYAERLYAMLRPLPGFEAFYLADVGARTACRQLGLYDARLAPAPSPSPSPSPATTNYRPSDTAPRREAPAERIGSIRPK